MKDKGVAEGEKARDRGIKKKWEEETQPMLIKKVALEIPWEAIIKSQGQERSSGRGRG